MKTIRFYGFKFNEEEFKNLDGIVPTTDYDGIMLIQKMIKLKDADLNVREMPTYKHLSYYISKKRDEIYFTDEAGMKMIETLSEVFEPITLLRRRYENYRDKKIKSVKVSIKKPEVETDHEAIDFLNSIGATSYSETFKITDVNIGELEDKINMFIDYIEATGMGKWSLQHKDEYKITHKVDSSEFMSYIPVYVSKDYSYSTLIDEFRDNVD